jgi:hypothetical protein
VKDYDRSLEITGATEPVEPGAQICSPVGQCVRWAVSAEGYDADKYEAEQLAMADGGPQPAEGEGFVGRDACSVQHDCATAVRKFLEARYDPQVAEQQRLEAMRPVNKGRSAEDLGWEYDRQHAAYGNPPGQPTRMQEMNGYWDKRSQYIRHNT